MTDQDPNQEETKIEDAILSIGDDAPISNAPQAPAQQAANPPSAIPADPSPAEPAEITVAPGGEDISEDAIVEQDEAAVAPPLRPTTTAEPAAAQPEPLAKPASVPAQSVEPVAPKPGKKLGPEYVLPAETAPDVAARLRIGGIDLGTTYSAISCYSPIHERVETFTLPQIAEGQSSVPSVVYYPEGADPVVGTQAVNMRNADGDRVVDNIKRSMGDPWKKTIDGRDLAPETVSADILRAIMSEARTQDRIGEEKRVVITVPAYFEDQQLNATREAGKLAGLEVLALLPEPHAAALAFTVERVAETVDAQTEDMLNRHLMVFDLGGGTLDVALIKIAATKEPGKAQNVCFETLFKDGDRHLGGLDWDEELKNIVLEKYRQKIGDEEYNKVLQLNANLLSTTSIEPAKRALTALKSYKVNVGLGSMVEVTRDEFEMATAGLLQRCRILLKSVLDYAEKELHIPPTDIPVVMAGGSTKMPQIPRMIEEVSGRPPLKSTNPDLLVTIGAAYWAYLLVAGGSIPCGGVILTVPQGTEIVKYSVGVKTMEQDDQGRFTRNVYTELIPPLSKRGAKAEVFDRQLDDYLQQALDKYKTNGDFPDNDENAGIYADIFNKTEDGMTSIPVEIYSSKESPPTLEKAASMGKVYLMVPGGKKDEAVLIALGHDCDGILRGRSMDVESRCTEKIVIQRPAELADGKPAA
jgi:molecular chaperone DnaK